RPSRVANFPASAASAARHPLALSESAEVYMSIRSPRTPAAWLLAAALAPAWAAGQEVRWQSARPTQPVTPAAALLPAAPSPPGPPPTPAPAPAARELRLEELTALALERNPRLARAGFAVEAARGRAVQAGLYPNPTLQVTGDELGDRTGTGGIW